MEPPEFTCTVLHVSFWILGGEGTTQAEVTESADLPPFYMFLG